MDLSLAQTIMDNQAKIIEEQQHAMDIQQKLLDLQTASVEKLKEENAFLLNELKSLKGPSAESEPIKP